jgi:hypothetical protein
VITIPPGTEITDKWYKKIPYRLSRRSWSVSPNDHEKKERNQVDEEKEKNVKKLFSTLFLLFLWIFLESLRVFWGTLGAAGNFVVTRDVGDFWNFPRRT